MTTRHLVFLLVLTSFFTLAAFLGACGTTKPTSPPAVAPEVEIRAMLDRYFAEFKASRSEAIPEVWHVPGWVARGDTNLLLANEDEVWSFYRRILDTIEAEGYDHSDLLNAEITVSNPSCATIDFTFTRWNTDGEVMPPRVRPVSCVVLKNEGRWGINTLIFNTSSRIYD